MQLNEMGEFGLIRSIQKNKEPEQPLILGIGDDCAVLPLDEQYYQLMSCDLLMENVHFIRGKISAYELGYKSVAVNLSDIAAMGGIPQYILLSIALPKDYTVEEWQEFYRGVTDICQKYHVDLIGGDTTGADGAMAINVTVVGKVEKENLHLRSHAVPGDVIFVTGPLGGSRGGLELILSDYDGIPKEDRAKLMQCHCMPEPCVEEIRALNLIAGKHLHGLNDISDGLFSEVAEIAEASGVKCLLDLQAVPVEKACIAPAAQAKADPLDWACTGGEDYQLVGTLAGEQAEAIAEEYNRTTGKPLFFVGTVSQGEGVYRQGKNGEIEKIVSKGYNHFDGKGETL